jgi:hypothetical protein
MCSPTGFNQLTFLIEYGVSSVALRDQASKEDPMSEVDAGQPPPLAAHVPSGTARQLGVPVTANGLRNLHLEH